MARFDIGGYTRYNTQRVARGRAPVRPLTYRELQNTGVFANFKGIEGFIQNSEIVYAAKLAKASEVADYWKSIAPHWGDKPTKGAKPPTARGTNEPDDYYNSIKVVRDKGTVSAGSDAFPLAMWLEYGTYKMKAAACAARTLAHFGGTHIEGKAESKLFVG